MGYQKLPPGGTQSNGAIEFLIQCRDALFEETDVTLDVLPQHRHRFNESVSFSGENLSEIIAPAAKGFEVFDHVVRKLRRIRANQLSEICEQACLAEINSADAGHGAGEVAQTSWIDNREREPDRGKGSGDGQFK